MRAKTVVYYCTYLYVFIIAIEGPVPFADLFFAIFNRIVIKKTAVLNQVIFWILGNVCFVSVFIHLNIVKNDLTTIRLIKNIGK